APASGRLRHFGRAVPPFLEIRRSPLHLGGDRRALDPRACKRQGCGACLLQDQRGVGFRRIGFCRGRGGPPMRIIVGISGASGAAYGVAFLKRCPADEKYVILTRWGRNILKTEAGLSPEDLAPYAKKVYATDDLSAPFASGSNPFDALVIMPCSVATLGKIAHG